jgi:Ca2+-binding RTX toxin-like protein
MRSSRRHPSGRVAGSALLLVALFPAIAQAADVSVQGGTLRYASGSAANSVQIALPSPGRFQVTDSKADIDAGPGCTSTGKRRATCPTAGVTALAIDVGGGADRVAIDAAISLPATVTGGGGNDVLAGGSGGDRLEGGPGADTLEGKAGNDAELGGEGNDAFSQPRTPDGADGLSGGSGVDRVGYGKRTGALAISLDGAPNDGDRGASEGDNVGADVEQVSGGSGFDTIVGSAAKNRLDGGPGSDFIDGRGGADALSGGDGADRIGSRDLSVDELDCGAEGDRVRADSRDHVARDCEAVGVSAPILVRPVSSRLAGTGTVRLTVRCDLTAFGPCSGRVFVSTARRVRTREGLRRVRVGSRAFRVEPGTSEEVRVRVGSSARRLVRRHRRLVRAIGRGGDSAGRAAGVRTTFVLRR